MPRPIDPTLDDLKLRDPRLRAAYNAIVKDGRPMTFGDAARIVARRTGHVLDTYELLCVFEVLVAQRAWKRNEACRLTFFERVAPQCNGAAA